MSNNFHSIPAGFPLYRQFLLFYNDPTFRKGREPVKKSVLLLLGVGGSVLSLCLLAYRVCAISLYGTVPASVYDRPLQQEDCRKTKIQLPYKIPGSNLTIVELAVYEGPFVEDYSEDEVVDIAAILLRNDGPALVNRAEVSLCWEDGFYSFDARMIPAGQTVLALETDRKPFGQQLWTDCVCRQTTDAAVTASYQQLTVREIGRGEISVKNISDEILTDIRVYYKSFLSPPGVYVGGIVYCVGISELAPGATVEISPWRYVSDYSRVVCIRCNTN